MRWTEVLKNYPIILTHYKKKIAAKRRMKASQGLDETLTGQDMEQIGNDIIKTMKENLPDDVIKPVTYDDVVNSLKGNDVGKSLGFRDADFNAHHNVETPVENIPYEEVVTQEASTREMNPPVGQASQTPSEEVLAAEAMMNETPTEEPMPVEEPLPMEEPVVTEEVITEEVVTKPEEPDVNEGVGNVGKRIADEFKPLTPFYTAPIPAPLPYQTKYGQTNTGRPAGAPVKTNNNPQLGTSKIWDDDLKFWS